MSVRDFGARKLTPPLLDPPFQGDLDCRKPYNDSY